MPRRKKFPERPLNLSPEPSASPGSSGAPSEPEVIETQVETHEAGPDSFIDQAKEKLKGIAAGDAVFTPPTSDATRGQSKGAKWYRGQKAKQKSADLADVVSTILIVLIALWAAPEAIKPNSDEVDSFSAHLCNIILRHIDISMSEDVVDLAGIVAVMGAYFVRVGPDLRKWNEEQKRVIASRPMNPPPVPGYNDGSKPGEVVIEPSPIQRYSPDAAAFLGKVQNEPGE